MQANALRILIGAGGLGALLIAVLVLALADNRQGAALQPAGQLGGAWSRGGSRTSTDLTAGFSAVSAAAAAGSDQVTTSTPASSPSLPVPGSGLALTQGGDAARGRAVFFENARVNCSKCHAIRGQGGNIGPELSDIGSKRTRAEILQSLQNPDQVISEGFHTLLVQTIDGLTLYGVVREDSPQQVRLVDVEGREHRVAVDDIEERRPGRSAMPADVSTYLTPQQIQDLVEFLASCR